MWTKSSYLYVLGFVVVTWGTLFFNGEEVSCMTLFFFPNKGGRKEGTLPKVSSADAFVRVLRNQHSSGTTASENASPSLKVDSLSKKSKVGTKKQVTSYSQFWPFWSILTILKIWLGAFGFDEGRWESRGLKPIKLASAKPTGPSRILFPVTGKTSTWLWAKGVVDGPRHSYMNMGPCKPELMSSGNHFGPRYGRWSCVTRFETRMIGSLNPVYILETWYVLLLVVQIELCRFLEMYAHELTSRMQSSL